jgi:hypothetical protein
MLRGFGVKLELLSRMKPCGQAFEAALSNVAPELQIDQISICAVDELDLGVFALDKLCQIQLARV